MIFDIENFNVIQDEEYYYFFRALNNADTQDIEEKITVDLNGNIQRIRTDRERYAEDETKPMPKYSEHDELSLEQIYNHIKMHYRKDTNCISFSSNANVSLSYGRGSYNDKYVMIRVPKKEMGKSVINAGQYMLQEIEKEISRYIETNEIDTKLRDTLEEIDEAKTSEEIKKIIEVKYTLKTTSQKQPKMRRGIIYREPVARISNYKSLNEDQSLEKNKILAKLTVLERAGEMPPIIPDTVNNTLLVQTIGNAFASMEQIHYGEVQGEKLFNITAEEMDIIALLQQVQGIDKNILQEITQEVINFVISGGKLEIPEIISQIANYKVRDDITIEDMYELTDGKVEFGIANSTVQKMFYLSKAQVKAKQFASILNEITGNNPRYQEVINYISENGFSVEPEIITRQNRKGEKLSESISLDLTTEEIELKSRIRELTQEDQIAVIEVGGLSDIKNIMSSTFAKNKKDEVIGRETYYVEAIFSLYDWNSIGIKEFTISEKANLLQRLQEGHVYDLYKILEERGIEKNKIPTVLLNIITRNNDFEIKETDTAENIKAKRLAQYERLIEQNMEELNQDLSIERIERFLGYYDVQGTGIQLREYQQRAVEKTEDIFEKERFASVILPTGGGKSFVTLAKLMQHKDEKMLYLAPQNEILEQMKDYIIKYIHGPVNTLGRSKDEIIKDIFPGLKFSTYPGLLSDFSKETINTEYGFIVLDELHRTGAEKWGEKLNTLISNQGEKTRVLGITATPRRDSDGINMANEIAERLGYTNADATSGKHIAMNMSLINAIRMGLVVNPKLISCVYNLKTDGSLDIVREQIEGIEDIEKRNEMIGEYEKLRRSIEMSDGVSTILQNNVKKGGKYIVFLPVVDVIEDEDGNRIGRKKGKDKLADYEKQIMEYFKDSDITPHFHSMLGEYGDKDNERRLEEFQNANTEDTAFMLVINKANEGLHLKKLDGIIWLRPLDDNSKILYLQQLGRVIYSENPDKPTKEEDRPLVFDLTNNTIKVNWEEEITEKDDIEILSLILDWVEKHDGILPNIMSHDKEEKGYAKVLKEIQGKYKKYIGNNFENLNNNQIEEIKQILGLGATIDLWQIELPDIISPNNGEKGISFGNKDEVPFFEVVGLLKDFVEFSNEVNKINNKTVYEEVIEFLESHDGKLMHGAFFEKGKKLKINEMTKEQQEEVNLYNRWWYSEEKRILAEYEGRLIEEVPEEYRAKIEKLRALIKKEKMVYEEVIEFLENHNGKIMQGYFRDEKGKKLKINEMTKEQQEEVNLYRRWLGTVERKILEEYEGRPIGEVPEEYRKKIEKLRALIKKEKTVYEEVIEFLKSHNGKLMKASFREKGKILKRSEMTKEQQEEAKLYMRWNKSEERKILEEYEGHPIEEVPEEYRAKIEKLRSFSLGAKEKIVYEEVIEFLESHDGKLMQAGFREKGKILKRGEMTKEQQEEVNLYNRWWYSEEKRILAEYEGRPIGEVPEEYRAKIEKLRSLIMQEKTVYEEVIEFLESNDGKLMHSQFSEKGKKLKRSEMTKEQQEEANLYNRWNKSEERKILEKYEGHPIEEVPEEYRAKIEKLRSFSLGAKEKTVYEEVIEFLESHDGKLMHGAFFEKGKILKRSEMTKEQQEEVKLYDSWRRTEERKILEEYEGRPIEEVPEEYREKVEKLRSFGLGMSKSALKSAKEERDFEKAKNEEARAFEQQVEKTLRDKKGDSNHEFQSHDTL